MTKKTPFWREGMGAEERAKRVADLFAMIDRALDADHGAEGVFGKRTFVFAPDPPPRAFDEVTAGDTICRVRWGVAVRPGAVFSSDCC